MRRKSIPTPAGTALPGHNADVAAIFDESADLRELAEANPFRVRADRNAARVVRDLSRDVTGLGAAGEDHTELPSVGEDLAGKNPGDRHPGRCALLRAAVSSLSRPTAGVCRACCCYSARRSQRSCRDGSCAAQAPPPTSTGPIYLQAAARRKEPSPPSPRVARGIDPGKSAEAALSRALDALREFGLTNSVAAGEEAAHE